MGRQRDATRFARTLRDLLELPHGPRAWALSDAVRRLLEDSASTRRRCWLSRGAAHRQVPGGTRAVALQAGQRTGTCATKQGLGGPP
jgi:hypothetical protein